MRKIRLLLSIFVIASMLVIGNSVDDLPDITTSSLNEAGT